MSDKPVAQSGNTSLAAAMQDRNGNTSSTRVAGFWALFFVSLMIGFDQMTPHKADPANVIALLVFSAACFALKIPEWLGKPK